MRDYLPDTLPSAFDTPMFWDDHDLQELQGTAVVGRSSHFPPFVCQTNTFGRQNRESRR